MTTFRKKCFDSNHRVEGACKGKVLSCMFLYISFCKFDIQYDYNLKELYFGLAVRDCDFS